MTYVDANIFIYPIIYEESLAGVSEAKDCLLKIAKGKMEACTAALTWDEIVWSVRSVAGTETSRIEGARFLTFPHLKILDVTESIITSAQDLMERYNLKPRDSIHAACAIESGAERILSDDEDFDRVRELRRMKLR